MKKIIISALTALGIIALLPAIAMAKTATTDVTGTVTYKGSPVKGAVVTVSCVTTTKKPVKTNVSGNYLVTFNAKNCPVGSTVNVSATWDGFSGSSTGTAGAVTTKLNVGLVNVSVVPEFGTIAGITAATVSGGAFLAIRRRNLSGHKV